MVQRHVGQCKNQTFRHRPIAISVLVSPPEDSGLVGAVETRQKPGRPVDSDLALCVQASGEVVHRPVTQKVWLGRTLPAGDKTAKGCECI